MDHRGGSSRRGGMRSAVHGHRWDNTGRGGRKLERHTRGRYGDGWRNCWTCGVGVRVSSRFAKAFEYVVEHQEEHDPEENGSKQAAAARLVALRVRVCRLGFGFDRVHVNGRGVLGCG